MKNAHRPTLNLSAVIAGLPFPELPATVVPAAPTPDMIPIATVTAAVALEGFAEFDSILIAERMLATARPCSQDGLRFLLGMMRDAGVSS